MAIFSRNLVPDLTGFSELKGAAQYAFRYFFRQTGEFSRFRENLGSSGMTENLGELQDSLKRKLPENQGTIRLHSQ